MNSTLRPILWDKPKYILIKAANSHSREFAAFSIRLILLFFDSYFSDKLSVWLCYIGRYP